MHKIYTKYQTVKAAMAADKTQPANEVLHIFQQIARKCIFLVPKKGSILAKNRSIAICC